MVVSFILIWLNVLIVIIALHTVSSRSTVQTDHHDIDDISLNPAYGGKPPIVTLPSVITSCCNDGFCVVSVSHQDMPQDGHDEAPDYMII